VTSTPFVYKFIPWQRVAYAVNLLKMLSQSWKNYSTGN